MGDLRRSFADPFRPCCSSRGRWDPVELTDGPRSGCAVGFGGSGERSGGLGDAAGGRGERPMGVDDRRDGVAEDLCFVRGGAMDPASTATGFLGRFASTTRDREGGKERSCSSTLRRLGGEEESLSPGSRSGSSRGFFRLSPAGGGDPLRLSRSDSGGREGASRVFFGIRPVVVVVVEPAGVGLLSDCDGGGGRGWTDRDEDGTGVSLSFFSLTTAMPGRFSG